MAKREAGPVSPEEGAAAAAPPPVSSPPAPGSAAAPVAKEMAGKIGTMAAEAAGPLVIKWKTPADEGDATSVGEAAAAGDGEQQAETPASETASEEQATEEQAAEGETEEATEEEKQEAADKPAPKPPKARAILERIRAEKAKLKAEEVAAAERTQRQQLEQQLARFTTGPIGARLAALGITTEEQRQQLAEAILLGKDEVTLPAGAPPSTDQRVAELEKKLQAEEQAKQAAIAQQTYQKMHGAIVTMTSDMDLGVVKAVEKIVGPVHSDGQPAGMHLVTAVAKQMWEEAGRPANSLAIVRKAAERVVEHYRTAYPEVFAKEQGQGTGKPAAKRPAMGQRVAPKPGANGRKLPLDREDRDAAIKREFGW